MIKLKFKKSSKFRHMSFAFCQVTIIATLLIFVDHTFASSAQQCANIYLGGVSSPQVSPELRLQRVLTPDRLPFSFKSVLWREEANSKQNLDSVVQYLAGLITDLNAESLSFPFVFTVLEKMPKGSKAMASPNSSYYFPKNYMSETYLGDNWNSQNFYLDIEIIMQLLYRLRRISQNEAELLRASVDDLLKASVMKKDSQLLAKIRIATEQLIRRASGSIHDITNAQLKKAFLDHRAYNSIILDLEFAARGSLFTEVTFDDIIRVFRNMPRGTKIKSSSGNFYFPSGYLSQVMKSKHSQSKENQYLDFSIIMNLLYKLEPLDQTKKNTLETLVTEILESSREFIEGDAVYKEEIKAAVRYLLNGKKPKHASTLYSPRPTGFED